MPLPVPQSTKPKRWPSSRFPSQPEPAGCAVNKSLEFGNGCKVLTANRLIDGQAVWLGADGSWQETIDGALVARHAEAVEALEDAGNLAAKANLVVDVNVIDVEERGRGFIRSACASASACRDPPSLHSDMRR